MDPSIKTKVAVLIGIVLIASVASLLILPFVNSDSAVEKISHDKFKKLEDSEEKMFSFMAHEKKDLESKIGGKIKSP